MSLIVRAAQTAAQRKYSLQDVYKAAQYSVEVGENESSTISEKLKADMEYLSVFMKAVLRRPYDYNDVLVKSPDPDDDSYIHPPETELVDFFKGKGPIENRLSSENTGKIQKVFCQLIGKNVNPESYKHDGFVEAWIDHLSFSRKGTEFSNYLKQIKRDILTEKLTEKQIEKAKRLFELVPNSLKKKYAEVIDKDGRTAFHWAAQKSEDLAEVILNVFDDDERSEYAQKRDKNGDTAFHLAIKKVKDLPNLAAFIPIKDLANLAELIPIKDLSGVLQTKDSDGNTVLHIFAKRGNAFQILALLKKLPCIEDVQKCIQAKNSDGDNFLFISARMKNNTVALQTIGSEFKLARFVDNLINKLPGLRDIIKDIEKKSNDINAFCKKVSESEECYLINEAQELCSIFSQARLECLVARDSQNDTLLHLAVRNKDISLMKQILKEKQVLLEKDDLGFTALEIAVIMMRKDVIEEILGALNLREVKALNLAIVRGDIRFIKLILKGTRDDERVKYILEKDATGVSPFQLVSCKTQCRDLREAIEALIPENDQKKIQEFSKFLDDNNWFEKIQKLKISTFIKEVVVEGLKDVLGGINDGLFEPIFAFLSYYKTSSLTDLQLEGLRTLPMPLISMIFLIGTVFVLEGLSGVYLNVNATNFLKRMQSRSNAHAFGLRGTSFLSGVFCLLTFLELIYQNE